MTKSRQPVAKPSVTVGGSRAQQSADSLPVPASSLFEGAATRDQTSGASGPAADVTDFVATSESLALTRALARIPDEKLRKSIVQLAEQIAARYPVN
jgi:hypothetical protein